MFTNKEVVKITTHLYTKLLYNKIFKVFTNTGKGLLYDIK